MDVRERVLHWYSTLEQHATSRPYLNFQELTAAVGTVEDGTADAMVDARVQRALLGMVKARLDANPKENLRFVKSTGWKILDQLLAAARLKELTRVKIVKRGRSGGLKFDCSELAETFYGAQVMEGLGFGKRRRVLDRDEYDKVAGEFAKIKLTLPEAIEPTTTERFFSGED